MNELDCPLRVFPVPMSSAAIYYPKSAVNYNVDATSSPVDLWEGSSATYTGLPAGAGEKLSVVSTSTDDTYGGDGANTLTIVGCGAARERVVETIQLNGTTPVVTSNTFTRVNRAFVDTAGEDCRNNGVITGTHMTTTSNVFFAVQVGVGQEQVGAVSIPTGYVALFSNLKAFVTNVSASSVEALIAVETRMTNGAWRRRRTMSATSTSGLITDKFDGGLLMCSGCDLLLRVIDASASGLTVGVSMEIFLFEA